MQQPAHIYLFYIIHGVQSRPIYFKMYWAGGILICSLEYKFHLIIHAIKKLIVVKTKKHQHPGTLQFLWLTKYPQSKRPNLLFSIQIQRTFIMDIMHYTERYASPTCISVEICISQMPFGHALHFFQMMYKFRMHIYYSFGPYNSS